MVVIVIYDPPESTEMSLPSHGGDEEPYTNKQSTYKRRIVSILSLYFSSNETIPSCCPIDVTHLSHVTVERKRDRILSGISGTNITIKVFVV